MVTTRMSTKGQIVVPQAVREALAWKPGMTFELILQGTSVVLRPVSPFAPTRLEDVAGCTGYRGPPVSLEDMEAGIARAVKAAWEEESLPVLDPPAESSRNP